MAQDLRLSRRVRGPAIDLHARLMQKDIDCHRMTDGRSAASHIGNAAYPEVADDCPPRSMQLCREEPVSYTHLTLPTICSV
eukprot:8621553-Alexandrium_andersonii.AAC.1